MSSKKRVPFTAEYAGRTVLTFAVMNALFIVDGRPRVALYLDLIVAGLMAVGILGTRYWPDKVRFKQIGE